MNVYELEWRNKNVMKIAKEIGCSTRNNTYKFNAGI
jgi:hypothetical protein